MEKVLNLTDNATLVPDGTEGYLDQIIELVDAGIFFLGPDLKFENPCNKKFLELVRLDCLDQLDFHKFLQNKIPDKTITEAIEFLDLMFDREHEEETIKELNPLRGVEFHFSNEIGFWGSSKFFSFKFRRFYDVQNRLHLFGTVEDVTNQVEQGKELQNFEKNSRRQMQWLISMLHVELPLLNEFMMVVEYELAKIDKLLKSAQNDGDYLRIISQIINCSHHISSGAVIVNLDFFTKESFEFKDAVTKLKSKEDLNGTDFIPVVVAMGNLNQILNEVKGLVKHINNIDHSLRTTRRFDGGLIVRLIENLIKHITKSSGKNVRLKYDNFDSLKVPFKYKQITKEFLIALTQFVVEFSIENAEKRKSLNVNPTATIEIESCLHDKLFEIKYRHDGNLMRVERMLQESIYRETDESDPNALAEMESHPGLDVLKLFFTPDYSLSESTGTTETHQIMEEFEIAKKKLKLHNGRIKVAFASEAFCEYTISFPYKHIGKKPD
jgi:cell division FtsZ-interacting protein ZapD